MYNFDNKNNTLKIGRQKFVIEEENHDAGEVYWNPEYKEIQDLKFTFSDYPNWLTIASCSENGFNTFLFHDFEILNENGFKFIDFICDQPNKYWEGKYGLSTLLVTISEVVKDFSNWETNYISIESDWKELRLRFKIESDYVLNELISALSETLNKIIKQSELILSGAVWRKEYDNNESLFCTEIIFPLIRKMGYLDVRYLHGVKEYGKDFTFSELTKYGSLMHFGLQAKAGDISGKVNAPIDEIIGQLNDAFSMSYWNVSGTEKRHISIFIVAISGYYTDNAKDKIIKKIPSPFKGCVCFFDRDKILELIEKFWK
jgi:hypothetical protein